MPSTQTHAPWVVLAALMSAAVLVASGARGVFFGITALELGVVALLAVALLGARTVGRSADVPRVSVLVAAWNERPGIEGSIRSLLTQTGVELEVVVADDGSGDGTAACVEAAFAGDARVRVVRLEHAGKGAALEAARRVARHPLLATVDADTELEAGALAKLASVFTGTVVAAGGAVLVRDARGVLGRFQYLEYLRTTWIRAGWAALGMLEQLPGAFSMFRADALSRAGGFPLDSLTEDYEVVYRLYAEAARSGRPMSVSFVPEARAWTAPPSTLAGYVGQRTRWFAGFLSTWVRFRGLLLRPAAGRFGLLRMPIKAIDALTPIVVLAALCSLFVGDTVALTLGLLPLAVRVLGELALYRAARALAPDAASPFGSRLTETLVAAIDGATYGLFRSLVVLRAYPFAIARVEAWERSRPLSAPSPEADAVPAE